MEKHQSQSSARKRAPITDADYDISFLRIGRDIDASRKISREDVSKCISIWAKLYHLQDDEADKSELRMPSRPWMGRDPNSIKRFE
jgi:hypothetical protein